MERELNPGDPAILARFRQGVQCLRESIQRGETLRTYESERDDEWKASISEQGRGAACLAFKDLAAHVAEIATHREAAKAKKESAAATAELVRLPSQSGGGTGGSHRLK